MGKPTSKKLNAILENEGTETAIGGTGRSVTSKKLDAILSEDKPRYLGHTKLNPETPHILVARRKNEIDSIVSEHSSKEDVIADFASLVNIDVSEIELKGPVAFSKGVVYSLIHKGKTHNYYYLDISSKLSEDTKPKLDRHGRIKVPHWGSDDEQEEGTVKAELRELPPKRSFKEAEDISESRIMYPFRYFIKGTKWKLIKKATTRQELIEYIQRETKQLDVRLGNPKQNAKGNYQYPVFLGGRSSSKHVVMGLGELGGPLAQ